MILLSSSEAESATLGGSFSFRRQCQIREFGSRKVRAPILGESLSAAYRPLAAERDWRTEIAQGSR
jgi:hypothetical protein